MTINDILAIRPETPERESRESRYGKTTKTVKGFTGKNDTRTAWTRTLETALQDEGLLTRWASGGRTNGFFLDYYRYKDSNTVGLKYFFNGKEHLVCEFRLRYKVVGSTYSYWGGDHNTYEVKTVELGFVYQKEASRDEDLAVVAAKLAATYSAADSAARNRYNEVAERNEGLISALADWLSLFNETSGEERQIICNEVLKRMHPDETEESFGWLPTIKIAFDPKYHG